ncbi:Eco29kI family restriction endonuclease [Brevibacillus agri]|uniref:Eco29kI family restriction endonuclease n=1 Tax=Brevibacillus TaxID=55080 RepID=UPI000F076A7B|nr:MULTISPECIES: Eco29kI family restriction endonuclease [Brevibacillus]MCG5254531.1 Eco29kI family restriction endonuclease [Brevibacillus agri]MCM3625485.1 Eco29kI family restriction endonuclease [Brevibacillus borstelensis]MED1641976.1 Eco29kI family restriction endonuclease [Brevibacillus agri]MED1657802.1 Eco29kI family restriction endonuclease [Brevibacillus agri]MED1689762.1 Eco29kI family restriction endonuclease [Brevibacillus agri]
MLIPGFDEFELDLELAFKRDLPPFIEKVIAAPLTYVNVESIPIKKNGVYLLLQNDTVMYVGKTDSKAGFHSRLTRHATHLQHRKNLDPSSITFKAVAIPVFKNADLESILIQHYGAPWNFSGFGGNDPGRQRDTQKPADFDISYPIDVDLPIEFIIAGTYSCGELLKRLSANLPYTFRFEKQAHQEELNTPINVPSDNMTVRSLLTLVIEHLPKGAWQATILFGRIILYREQRDYPYFQDIIRA